ncbi:MAG: RNA polymerase subunit sigma-70 [Actinomycetota bacterium]|nr:RNA polymerase subunit sigma-70 [Actinomycetota bacterium]
MNRNFWRSASRSTASSVQNLGGWLTTVVSRVCLNMLRSRETRREEPLEVHVPDPIVSRPEASDPEHEAQLADAVGLALLVVLDRLQPAERLAFVLHDMFAVPFDDIAAIVGRSPDAARQLASRGRRRVRGAAPVSTAGRARQRQVVDAFFAAARQGDFDGLLAVLAPDVVLRTDTGSLPTTGRAQGAQAVAGGAVMFAKLDRIVRPALVNGAAGAVISEHGEVVSVMGFTVIDDRIVAIDVLADPDRLRELDLTALDA